MAAGQEDVELLTEDAQIVASGGGHEHSRQFVGVNGEIVVEDALLAQEADIKLDVVSEDGVAADKVS